MKIKEFYSARKIIHAFKHTGYYRMCEFGTPLYRCIEEKTKKKQYLFYAVPAAVEYAASGRM